MGFIAQDIEKIISGTEMSDCDLYHSGGENGYASLCYEEIIAPLVEGWQHHEAIIEKQNLLIEKLEKRVGELEEITKGN